MSNDNLTLILTEFEELKGQFVITALHKIERLVAIASDNDDYYYVTYNGKECTFNSCVGRIMPLKGYLRDDDYNELIRMAKLNHYDYLSEDNEFDNAFKEYQKHLTSNGIIMHTHFCFKC